MDRQTRDQLPDPLDVCLRSYDGSQAAADAFREAAATSRLRLWATIAAAIALAVWGVFSIYLVCK